MHFSSISNVIVFIVMYKYLWNSILIEFGYFDSINFGGNITSAYRMSSHLPNFSVIINIRKWVYTPCVGE